MLKISRESEINLVNVLIDNDIISGKDLINIKKVSTESNKSQIDAIFELKLTDEKKIIDPIKKAINMLVIKMINVDYLDLRWSKLNSFGPLIAKIKKPPASAIFFRKLVSVIGSAKSFKNIIAVAIQNNPSAIEDNLT